MTRNFLKKRNSLYSLLNCLSIQDKIFILFGALLLFIYPIPEEILQYQNEASLRFYDRNGYLLREIISSKGGRGRWVALENISPQCIQAAVVAEDHRFYSHRGIDYIAIVRAIRDNIRAGRKISGASTISAQLIRNLYNYPRNPLYKIIEFWQAIRLEYTLTKSQILEQYLNRIPFGNQTFGVEAASQLYFGKSAAELSWAESAYLMALPKSPTHYNPYRNTTTAKNRQQTILKRLRNAGIIDSLTWERALHEILVFFPKNNPFYAPHFTDWLAQKNWQETEIHTTLDLPLQDACEKIVRGHVQTLQIENVTNAAVLVVENRTGFIRAMIGSADYFNDRYDGQFNAVFAKRQPGSALKPFTYALAFEQGFTPATILPDVETVIETSKGRFTPLNYDNQFHGPVRARTALACSYNVPAVRLAQKLGIEPLLDFFRHCGLESLSEPAEYYGHGLTLGNGEVSLFELTQAYCMLANDGRHIVLSAIPNPHPVESKTKIISDLTVYWISDILSDPSARAPAFGLDSPLNLPFPCAVKTGTSSNYRDNWTMGFTRDYTVGVWVGNFDNQPMREISGVTGAGPIFRDIMLLLHSRHRPAPFPVPPGVLSVSLCAISGQIPHEGCFFRIREVLPSNRLPDKHCAAHDFRGNISYIALGEEYVKWTQLHKSKNRMPTDPLLSNVDPGSALAQSFKILSPKANTQFIIDPSIPRQHQSIPFEVLAPPSVKTVKWYLNNQYYTQTSYPFKTRWHLTPGKYILRAEIFCTDKVLYSETEFEVIE